MKVNQRVVMSTAAATAALLVGAFGATAPADAATTTSHHQEVTTSGTVYAPAGATTTKTTAGTIQPMSYSNYYYTVRISTAGGHFGLGVTYHCINHYVVSYSWVATQLYTEHYWLRPDKTWHLQKVFNYGPWVCNELHVQDDFKVTQWPYTWYGALVVYSNV